MKELIKPENIGKIFKVKTNDSEFFVEIIKDGVYEFKYGSEFTVDECIDFEVINEVTKEEYISQLSETDFYEEYGYTKEEYFKLNKFRVEENVFAYNSYDELKELYTLLKEPYIINKRCFQSISESKGVLCLIFEYDYDSDKTYSSCFILENYIKKDM